jgi:biotin operon repressor/anti-sigma regulatory factor (Ser/Thr protein kinase)
MVGIRKRGENIRQFILDNVENHPRDLAAIATKTFDISRQAVNKHIQRLIEQGALIVSGGKTKNRHYLLHTNTQWETIISLEDKPAEDRIWRDEIELRLGNFPDNVRQIWRYGFTEMMNNAIDHSEGTQVAINIIKTATSTEIVLFDNGIGIFRKIQKALGLEDERHAVLELSKGKLTTDPARHTGEGIFFSSRMFDDFRILSGNVFFSHTHAEDEDWILENQKFQNGTGVFMKLKNNTARTVKKVFDEFTSDEDYGFTKTVVPVRLAQYGDETLISRSQAKRLLARVDRFKMVILDFDNVETIGQAFSDEVFRVFVKQHPNIEIVPIKTNKNVQQMIRRAQSYSGEENEKSEPMK